MSRRRCKACKGEYETVLTGGLLYHHVCPPLTVLGEQPDPDKPNYTPPTFPPRPGHRDERLVEVLVRDEDGNVRKRSTKLVDEGDGVDELDEA